VLEVGGQDDGLVSGLAGELDTKVPGVERDKGKFAVGWNLIPHKLVDSGDSVPEVTSGSYNFVRDCCKRS
jgi:hypothetical protein